MHPETIYSLPIIITKVQIIDIYTSESDWVSLTKGFLLSQSINITILTSFKTKMSELCEGFFFLSFFLGRYKDFNSLHPRAWPDIIVFLFTIQLSTLSCNDCDIIESTFKNNNFKFIFFFPEFFLFIHQNKLRLMDVLFHFSYGFMWILVLSQLRTQITS